MSKAPSVFSRIFVSFLVILLSLLMILPLFMPTLQMNNVQSLAYEKGYFTSQFDSNDEDGFSVEFNVFNLVTLLTNSKYTKTILAAQNLSLLHETALEDYLEYQDSLPSLGDCTTSQLITLTQKAEAVEEYANKIEALFNDLNEEDEAKLKELLENPSFVEGIQTYYALLYILVETDKPLSVVDFAIAGTTLTDKEQSAGNAFTMVLMILIRIVTVVCALLLLLLPIVLSIVFAIYCIKQIVQILAGKNVSALGGIGKKVMLTFIIALILFKLIFGAQMTFGTGTLLILIGFILFHVTGALSHLLNAEYCTAKNWIRFVLNLSIVALLFAALFSMISDPLPTAMQYIEGRDFTTIGEAYRSYVTHIGLRLFFVSLFAEVGVFSAVMYILNLLAGSEERRTSDKQKVVMFGRMSMFFRPLLASIVILIFALIYQGSIIGFGYAAAATALAALSGFVVPLLTRQPDEDVYSDNADDKADVD